MLLQPIQSTGPEWSSISGGRFAASIAGSRPPIEFDESFASERAEERAKCVVLVVQGLHRKGLREVAAATLLQYWYWRVGSQPAAARQLYKMLPRWRPLRIVEIGLQSAQHTSRLVRIAQRFAPGPIQYAGLDAFESRGTSDAISLKAAHRLLSQLGVKAQFFPGDPAHVLPGVANRLLNNDLIVVSPSLPADALVSTWSFWPRMLHEKSTVAIWDAGRQAYTYQTLQQVRQRADSHQASLRRAA